MTHSKNWFWILLNVLIVIIVLNVVFFVMPMLAALRASYPPARTMTVSAQGETIATPDLAEITFSVVSQGDNPQDLSSDNSSKMNAVLEFVSSQGIASSDIATTGYDLEPSYQYDKTSQRNFIVGYTLTQTVTVKVYDLTEVAPLLGGLTPLGVNQVGGVNFTFSDEDAALAPARADAFNKAKEKAIEMASEAGVTLGPIVSVSENGNVPQPLPYYAMAAGAGNSSAPSISPNIQPGTQDLTDSVTITYALQ